MERNTRNLTGFKKVQVLNENNQPFPRSGHRAVATDSDLWIWGGFHPRVSDDELNIIFRELWRFNFARQEWTLEQTTGDIPQATASSAVCNIGNSVFVFGGTGFPFGENTSNELFLLQLRTRKWQRLALRGDLIDTVYGASMIANDNHLYILCGTNRMFYNSDVFDVDLKKLTCQKIGQTFDEAENVDENGRYRQEAYLHKNKIYLFGGGGASGHSFGFRRIPVFDLSTKNWTIIDANPNSLRQFPRARRFHSVLPFGESQIIMFGGAHFDFWTSEHVPVDNAVWLFDFDIYQWNRLTITLPQQIYFHAAAINNREEIYIHGGVINQHDEFSSPERITTIYQLQTRTLSLGEIAWNLFLKSLPNRQSLGQRDLLVKLDIPSKFIKRIDLNVNILR